MTKYVLNISLNTSCPQQVPPKEYSAGKWYSLFEDEHGHIATLSYPEREFLKDKIFSEVRKSASIQLSLQKPRPVASHQKGAMKYVLAALTILVAMAAITAVIVN